MTMVIITHYGLPKGPRKVYPFQPRRIATILKVGSIADACITKRVSPLQVSGLSDRACLLKNSS